MNKKIFFLLALFSYCSAHALLWEIASGLYTGVVYVPRSVWGLFSGYWWPEVPASKMRFLDEMPTPEQLDQLYAQSSQAVEAALVALPEKSKKHLFYVQARLQLAKVLQVQDGGFTIAQCEQMREIIMLLMRRADPGFAANVDETCKVNLGKCGLVPTNIYSYLGFDEAQRAGVSAREIRQRLLDRLRAAQTDDERSQLRQVGFLVRNAVAKEEFDAYLKGPQALNDLQLPAEILEPLAGAFVAVSVLKDSLARAQKEA